MIQALLLLIFVYNIYKKQGIVPYKISNFHPEYFLVLKNQLGSCGITKQRVKPKILYGIPTFVNHMTDFGPPSK